MSQQPESSSFVPRENLKRTLTYRRHLKWSYWATLAMGVVLGALAFSMFGWVATFVVICVVSIYAEKIRKPKAYALVTVYGDRVEIESLGQKKIFPYQEIKNIQFNYAPYLGGLFEIFSDKGSYKFPISLERSEYALEAIVAFNPNLASKEEIEKYRKTAVLTDHGWAYFHDNFPSLSALILKFIVTPLIAALPLAFFSGSSISAFDGKKFIMMSFIFCLIQILMSGLALKAESVYLMTRAAPELSRNPNNLKRNLALESKVHRNSERIQKILLAGLVLIYCIKLLK